MPPFSFRLEQVRLYRKQLEEQAMQALAQAVMQRDATKARIAALEEKLLEQRARLCEAHSLSSGERWLAGMYETALKQDLAEAERLFAEQENLVDQRRVDLVQKAKDHGLLDNLKKKQTERHLLAERQKEQHTNDETATLRHSPVTI